MHEETIKFVRSWN